VITVQPVTALVTKTPRNERGIAGQAWMARRRLLRPAWT
jgi:hypothetical protein